MLCSESLSKTELTPSLHLVALVTNLRTQHNLDGHHHDHDYRNFHDDDYDDDDDDDDDDGDDDDDNRV